MERLVKPRPINWLKRLTAKTQAFALISVKNIIWTKSSHACRSTSAKFGHFFAFRKVFLPPLWMKLYSYWTFFHASLIWLPLFVNFRINSEQYFYMPVSAYLIYGDFTVTVAVCLFSFFAWIVQIFYLNLTNTELLRKELSGH